MTSKFIVFEGGEGSGKSSHVQLTVDFLRQRSHNAVATHEPGGTAVGQVLRRLILEETLATRTELLLFLADRAQHVAEQIQPWLERGNSVVCDRFTGSTLAYQVGARQLQPENLIQQMEQFARANLEPDLTIYLDVDPAVGVQRKKTQPGHDLNSFDEFDLEFHQAVRDYFLRYAAEHDHWVVLDASRKLTAVQFDINQRLAELYAPSR